MAGQGKSQKGQAQQDKSGSQTRHVNLNTASVEEIRSLPMIGQERAEVIFAHRPYHSWEDVSKIPGFSTGLVNDLKDGGAVIEQEEE